MSDMEIRGSIWPSGLILTLPNLRFSSFNSDTGNTTTFRCFCTASKVVIECDAPDLTNNDPSSIGFVVANARMLFDGAISLASIHAGRGARFVAESIILAGNALDINIEYSNLTGLITAFAPDEFVKIMIDITNETQILLILSDLNSALSEPFYNLVGCGRAIDGIRHAIAGPHGDPEAAKWPEFRLALNVNKSYVQAITAASTKGRHGQRLLQHGHDIDEVLKRSWILFNRFLEYRKRRNTPLTPPEFPHLSG